MDGMLNSSWGPTGFKKPSAHYWRMKDETQIPIIDMTNGHIINAIEFLETKFGETVVDNWLIHQELTQEAIRRKIDGRKGWDH
jgi:hypothetical protein